MLTKATEPCRSRAPFRTTTALLINVVSWWIAPAYAVIVNGPPPAADPRGWNSTLILRTGIGVCTATIIGPRTILTAAHCLGQEKSVAVEFGGVRHTLDCQTHPDYAKTPAADFALCGLSTDLATPPERINTDPKLLSRGTKVIITGYGCRVAGGVDAQIGEFRAGSATLIQTPDKAPGSAWGITVGSSVCPGDGGGGVYLYTGSDQAKRVLIAVNAQGDANAQSFIAMTSTDLFLSWAASWSAPPDPSKPGDAARPQRTICGLRGDEGCQAGSGGAVPQIISREEVRSRLQAVVPSLSLPQSVPPSAEDKRESILAARVMKVTTVPGMTAATLAEKVCGGPQPPSYFSQFEKYNEESKAGFDLGTSVFDTAREITLPICAAASRIVVVQTSKNDKVRAYYRQYSDSSHPWTEYERPDGMSNLRLSSTYFLDVFAELNPGVNVQKLPENTTVFVPRYPISTALANSEPALAVSAQTVSAVFGLPSNYPSCSPGAERADYPYDLVGVLRALQTNRRFRKGDRWQPIPVLIADSGLDGAGINGVFESTTLLPRVEFNQLLADITPQIKGNGRGHGTQVASIILGGPLFSRIQVATEPRVKLVIRPIYVTTQEGKGSDYPSPEVGWWGKIVKAAIANSAQIVNMSLKTQTPIPLMADEFKSGSNVLYIVAAGNLDGDITQKEIYPARYGASGTGHLNLISVAALSVTKEGFPAVASFSNFGADYVDIGAPGCLVPALSYDTATGKWRTDRVNGTSFAAPLVSFAAAMIKSEIIGNFGPIQTKRRLLASADLDIDLSAEIEDGRTLNLVKALSVYQDVVELNSRAPLWFGDLTFKQHGDAISKIDLTCTGKNPAQPLSLSVAVTDIYKIWPNYTADQKTKVYFKGADGELLVSKECTLPSDLRVEIIDESKVSSGSIPISEVRDIVRIVGNQM